MFLFESVRFQRLRLEKRRIYERERERERDGGRKSLFSGNVHSNFPRGRVSHVNESCTSSLFIRERHEMCIAFFPALSGKHLRTWPVCRAAFYQLENFRSTNVLSPDYRDRFVRSEKRYENG